MGRTKWSEWDWSFFFFQVPEHSHWLNSIKDNFSSSRYNHSCLRTALIGCFHFLTLRRKKRFKVNSLSQQLQMRTAGRKSTLTQAIFWETTQNFQPYGFLITILFTYHHSQKSNEGHDAQLQEVSLRKSHFGICRRLTFSAVLVSRARASWLTKSFQFVHSSRTAPSPTPSHVRVLGERLSRQLIHQII